MKRKCKICGSRFETPYLNRVWCDDECFKEYRQQQYSKAYRKAKERVVEKRQNPPSSALKKRSDYTAEAQREFNRFVRERDKDLPCISCGVENAVWHAGHYRTIGAYPELRFNEYNVNKQCERCNIELSGNIDGYRLGLIKKYGTEVVEWLEGPHPPLKLTESDLKALKDKYKKLP